ncbi:MAG: GcrA family cell cycle regulator [Pseudomonadota bacterium]
MSSPSWTDDRVELLKKLWLEGLSASQIAAQLGGVTRNAVIGKVHRLGMSGRVKASSSSPRSASAAPRAARKKTATASRTAGQGSGATSQNKRTSSGVVMGNVAMKDAISPETEFRLQQAAEDVVIPLSRELTLLEVSERTCKWPTGDPTSDDFSFCGAPVKEGSPYCEYHCKVAYQPSTSGRRRA